ncbi:hypothetical protein WICPIJ_000283 [Wickerhamomyces pijperi]|uniref:Uncharacterized protein n=1 Tax=Wickerhamomyces pijperi TaxID=599730 RepID=A0A9P8TS84_WICPI|nr:hypothetical protein WICPIJ_000283 [Wickerhamomyces pijperi]
MKVCNMVDMKQVDPMLTNPLNPVLALPETVLEYLAMSFKSSSSGTINPFFVAITPVESLAGLAAAALVLPKGVLQDLSISSLAKSKDGSLIKQEHLKQNKSPVCESIPKT